MKPRPELRCLLTADGLIMTSLESLGLDLTSPLGSLLPADWEGGNVSAPGGRGSGRKFGGLEKS